MSRKRKDPEALAQVPLYAQRIRNLREDHDLRQRQVADILKISQRTYADYELGNIRIPVDSLIVLARYYDSDMNYICGVTKVRKPFPGKSKT